MDGWVRGIEEGRAASDGGDGCGDGGSHGVGGGSEDGGRAAGRALVVVEEVL